MEIQIPMQHSILFTCLISDTIKLSKYAIKFITLPESGLLLEFKKNLLCICSGCSIIFFNDASGFFRSSALSTTIFICITSKDFHICHSQRKAYSQCLLLYNFPQYHVIYTSEIGLQLILVQAPPQSSPL